LFKNPSNELFPEMQQLFCLYHRLSSEGARMQTINFEDDERVHLQTH